MGPCSAAIHHPKEREQDRKREKVRDEEKIVSPADRNAH